MSSEKEYCAMGQILDCRAFINIWTDSTGSDASTSLPGPFPQGRVKALVTRMLLAHGLCMLKATLFFFPLEVIFDH